MHTCGKKAEPLNRPDKEKPEAPDEHIQAGAASFGVGRRRQWKWSVLFALSATCTCVPVFAQQKTGPGLAGDDSLTRYGITFYGVIDIGVQHDTHSAPFTAYRPAASGNIVRQNSGQSVTGLTPSNMGQSRVGLHGVEPLSDDWSAIFQVETFFNPQSGEIADSLKSLTKNNGRALSAESVGVDGSSAGQALQTAWVGLQSRPFGTLTFGRQVTFLLDGMIKYDPNYNASAFGLLGASNTFSGGGSQENNRTDKTLKYRVALNDHVHFGALYKFKGSDSSADTIFQADVGGAYSGASLDFIYSKENAAITATSLTAAQVGELPTLGYPVEKSLAATVSDNTALSVMASYQVHPFKFFAGYERLKYSNPTTPLSAGFRGIGGYDLAFVTNTAYSVSKAMNVYWTGVRYSVLSQLDLTVAYYGYSQNAYGAGVLAGCATSAHSVCSGGLQAFSLDADYRLTKRFDSYVGAMYSGVHDGAASGYLHSTNINPTVGVRYKF